MATTTSEAKIKFTADTAKFNSEVKEADSALSELRAELKLNKAQMANTGTSVDALTTQKGLLEQQDVALSQKLVALNSKLDAAQDAFGENSTEAKKLATQITGVKTAQANVRTQIDKATAAIEEQSAAEEEARSAYSLLSSEISSQESKVEKLERAVANAALEYGDSSDEVARLQQELADANETLSAARQRMSKAESAADGLGDELDDVADAASDAARASDDAGSSFGELLSADLAASALESLASSLSSLVDETEDYTFAMTQLETAYESSGRSAEEASETYQLFLGICGDTDQAVEAALDMNNLADAGADIDEWYLIAAGAVAQFGDALPVENLIESANETVRTATVTGGLADALNWTSVSLDDVSAALGGECSEAMAVFTEQIESGATTEDAMNEALAACSDESERCTFLTAVLSSQYSELGETFVEAESDIIDSRTATDDLTQAQADLAEEIRPLQTAVTELAAEGIGVLAENFDLLAPIVVVATAAVAAFAVAMNFSSIVEGVSGAFTTFNAVLKANPILTVVSVVALLVTAFVSLWENNEGFREFWIGLWEDVQEAAGEAWEWLDENVIQPLAEAFDGLVSFMGELFEDPFGALEEAGEGIVSWFDENFPGVSETVGTVIGDAQAFFDDPFAALRTAVDDVVQWVTENFQLPEVTFAGIKLPHLSVSGEFSLNPLSIPTISVSWYAKGAVFDEATIFGAAGGSLLGAGEAGPEAVAPISTLQQYIVEAVDGAGAADRVVAAIESLAGRATVLEIDGKRFAEATAKAADDASGSRQSYVSRGLAT